MEGVPGGKAIGVGLDIGKDLMNGKSPTDIVKDR